MVPDNHGLIDVALTSMALNESSKILAIKVHSDIVSDNSGSDNSGPDKCRFVMVPDRVSDNPGFDKHGSDMCALT